MCVDNLHLQTYSQESTDFFWQHLRSPPRSGQVLRLPHLADAAPPPRPARPARRDHREAEDRHQIQLDAAAAGEVWRGVSQADVSQGRRSAAGAESPSRPWRTTTTARWQDRTCSSTDREYKTTSDASATTTAATTAAAAAATAALHSGPLSAARQRTRRCTTSIPRAGPVPSTTFLCRRTGLRAQCLPLCRAIRRPAPVVRPPPRRAPWGGRNPAKEQGRADLPKLQTGQRPGPAGHQGSGGAGPLAVRRLRRVERRGERGEEDAGQHPEPVAVVDGRGVGVCVQG